VYHSRLDQFAVPRRLAVNARARLRLRQVADGDSDSNSCRHPRANPFLDSIPRRYEVRRCAPTLKDGRFRCLGGGWDW
jgi:hypothetical protein